LTHKYIDTKYFGI